MNKQYIGARYVPKFYEGTTGTEWENGVPYEPLTIVTYLNGSYTSKKPVPSGVGSPKDNPEYWANTGMYNAQVQEYIEKVEELKINVNELDDNLETVSEITSANNEAIEVLNGNHIVCIGDSYLEGYTPNGIINGWGKYVKNLLNLSDDEYHEFKQGGSGFGNASFNNLLTSAINSLSAQVKELVKFVVVAGGYNDYSQSSDNIQTNINNFVSTAKENFPNAKIYIFPVGWCCKPLVTDPVHSSVEYVKLKNAIASWYAGITGGKALTNPFSYITMMDNRCFSSDYVHPNNVGQQLIGRMIYSTIMGTHDNYIATFSSQQLANIESSGGTLTNADIKHSVERDVTWVTMNNEMTYTPSSPITVNCSPGQYRTLATYKDCALPAENGKVLMDVDCYVKVGTHYYNLPNAKLQFWNSAIHLYFGPTINTNNDNFLILSNVDTIFLRNKITRCFPNLDQ